MQTTLGSTVKDFREPRQPRGALPFDPLLVVAALGLVVFGVIVISGATADDIPGDKYYYVYRQVAYGVIGVVLMMVLSRFDYSRAREWKLGLYAAMIGGILLTMAAGVSARGSKRAIDLGFINLQSSELGTLLLILAQAGLHPTASPHEQGYQINQSLKANGSGGKSGRGTQATQTKLNFLPEHHTDFIFSVVGEEYGFVGAALVLSLFALMIWRALRIL